MRSLSAILLMVVSSVLVASAGARAETANTRVAPMPYAECLAIIAEASQEVDEEPVILVSSDDLQTVRINASDGFVTVSCDRTENKMTLTKSPVPEAAGMSASR
jgi:hypothetical protein